MFATLRAAMPRASRALHRWERKTIIAAAVVMLLWGVTIATMPVLVHAGGVATPLVILASVIYLAAIPLALVGGFVAMRWLIFLQLAVMMPTPVMPTRRTSSLRDAP